MSDPNRMIIAMLNNRLTEAEKQLSDSAVVLNSDAQEDLANISAAVQYYGQLHSLLNEARESLLKNSREERRMETLAFKIEALLR